MSYVTIDLVSDDGEQRKSRRDRRRTLAGALFLGALAALMLSSPPAPSALDALTINPTTLVFKPQRAGVQAVQMLSIENGSTTTFEAATIAVNDDLSQFVLTTEDCGTILPHMRCHAGVGFTPKAAGSYQAVLRIQGKAGGERDVELIGTGTGKPRRGFPPASTGDGLPNTNGTSGQANGGTTTGGETGAGGNPGAGGTPIPALPAFVLSQSVFQFGDHRLGTAGAIHFTIRNSGKGGGRLMPITLENDGHEQFRVDTVCGPGVMGPDGSCDGTITFTPSTPGLAEARLVVSDSTGKTQTAGVSGRGLLHQLRPEADVVKFAPTGVDRKEVAFTNTGDDDFVITLPVAEGPYSIGSKGCLGAIPPKVTCRVLVLSQDAGRASKGRRLILQGPQDPVVVELMPEVAIAPLRAFVRLAPLPDTFAAGEYARQILHVYNDGKGDLNIGKVVFDPPTAALQAAIDCKGPVAPGGECQVLVMRRGQYDPKTILVVISDASNSPTSLSLPARPNPKAVIFNHVTSQSVVKHK